MWDLQGVKYGVEADGNRVLGFMHLPTMLWGGRGFLMGQCAGMKAMVGKCYQTGHRTEFGNELGPIVIPTDLPLTFVPRPSRCGDVLPVSSHLFCPISKWTFWKWFVVAAILIFHLLIFEPTVEVSGTLID